MTRELVQAARELELRQAAREFQTEAFMARHVETTSRTAQHLDKLKRAAPVFRKALQDLYRKHRDGNPKIVSAITEAGKKFNEVIDLLQVIEYEDNQEMRER